MTRRVIVVLLLGVAVSRGFAAGEGIPFVFDPVPRIWGLDLGVGYNGLQFLPGRTTTLWLYAGGGWEQMPYWRPEDGSMLASYFDPRTGSIVDLPSAALPAGFDPSADPWYQRAEAKWQIGIVQGILPGARSEADLLSAFLFYRGRFDQHLSTDGSPGTLLALAALPDRSGIFMNSVLAGLALDDALLNAHHVQSGLAAELSVEWGPSWLANSAGGADFARLNGTLRFFVPVFDIDPSADRNRLSLYLAEFLSVDWATGPSVPLVIRQSFGGLSPRLGLGGAVRGLDSGSLDANLKAVNNFEARLGLPALFIPQIVPGLVAYFDAGWFDQVGEPGFSAMGIVASTGAGAFVNLFDFAELVGYANYRLIGVNADGGRFTAGLDFTFKF